jgi:hypothetical protein
LPLDEKFRGRSISEQTFQEQAVGSGRRRLVLGRGDWDADALRIDAKVRQGGTAGTFAFQWAQNATNVTGATVIEGSYLEYREI